MIRKLLAIAASCAALITPTLGYAANTTGKIVLHLRKTQAAVIHDSDHVWADKDLIPTGVPEKQPDIYTARRVTSAGTLLLSQNTSDCTTQSMCAFEFILIKKNHQSKILADGYMMWGGDATMSRDMKTLTVDTFNGEHKYNLK